MHKERTARITIVVLNYFKAQRVSEGLAALRQQSLNYSCSIVVVDNSVNNEQARILRENIAPTETLIVSTENVGYARGINLGAAAAPDCDYVLLVNPDIIVDAPNTIELLVAEMEANPEIGILAPTQVNDDGRPVEIARRFPTLCQQIARRIWPTYWHDHNLLEPLARKSSICVDWVQSSFTLIRGDFWRQVGGLDESYFVFMSDVEIAHQARKKSLDVVVTSAARVRADGLRASRGGPLSVFRNRIVRVHLRDALTYHIRHRTFFSAYSQ